MAIFRFAEEARFSLQGNHVAGLATRTRRAEEVEVWRARMDAGAATPPHRHDAEEVVVLLSGRGRARVEDDEVTFEAGDTLILPAGKVHQIFSDTESEMIAVMPLRTTIRSPDGEIMSLPWRA
jgi:quercetin dioxygenase-like cupin family protein